MKGDREQGRGIPWKAEYMGVPTPALTLGALENEQDSVRKVLRLVSQGVMTHAEASNAINAIQKVYAPATPEPPRSPGVGFYSESGVVRAERGDFIKFKIEYEDGPAVANMPTAAEAIAEAEAAFAEEPV